MMKKKFLNVMLLVSVGSCFAADSAMAEPEGQNDTEIMMQNDVLELNDFSKQFESQCPSVISQEDWNNYLLRLQMLSNVALKADPSTVETTENVLLTLGMNCKAEAAILLNSLPPVDAEKTDEVKDTVNQICERYIKLVSDAVVSHDLDNGRENIIEQVTQDLNPNAEDAIQYDDKPLSVMDTSEQMDAEDKSNNDQVGQDQKMDETSMSTDQSMEEVQPMNEVYPEEVVESQPMGDDQDQSADSMEKNTDEVVDSAE